MEDYEQSGSPKEATTDENGDLVHSLILCDRSLRDTARQIGIKGKLILDVLFLQDNALSSCHGCCH